MQQKTLFHSLMVQEPPPPGSKGEANKGTDWAAARRAKKYREEHDPEFYASLDEPWFFEEFYRFEGHVFPEPPDEVKRKLKKGGKKEKEDYEAVDREASANVLSFLEQFEKKNGGPPPALAPPRPARPRADGAAPEIAPGQPQAPDTPDPSGSLV